MASITRSAAAWPTFCRSTFLGSQATAEVTGGSVDNLKLLDTGKSEVGFTMVDSGWDALQGLDKFKEDKVNARTLVVLYPNRLHVVTIDGTGINKLADLKGKRRFDGRARQRHRDHGVSAARRGGHRQGQGHQSTAFLASNPAPISTDGFDVFVHEVIAAMTTLPCFKESFTDAGTCS